MTEPIRANLPWLDRLRMAVPGYGGYDHRGHRRKAAFALRDVLARRLSTVRTQIDEARDACERKNLASEIQALDRVGFHLDRLIQRVGGLGTRSEDFYGGSNVDVQKLDSIYALDHAILETSDSLVRRFEAPDVSHNLLAEVRSDLSDLERKLDDRAILLRQVG